MPKALCIVGMVISILIFILFLLDLLLQFPFSGASPAMDIGFIICSGVLGYMSLSAFWETV